MNLEDKLLGKGKRFLREIISGCIISAISLGSISCGGESDPPTKSIIKQNTDSETKPPITQSPPEQTPINHAPRITSTPITQVEENSTYQYRIQSSDLDGDILNYKLIDSPNWLSVTNDRISGTAPEVEVNTLSYVKVRVSDSRGGIADQSYTLLIKNVKNTQTLSREELEKIKRIDENGITFLDPKSFSEGDIIVGGISNETPHGILREVIGISNDRRTVQTRQATLEEALREGTLSFRQELSQENAKSYKVVAGASKVAGNGFGFSINLKDVNLSMDSKDKLVEQGLIADGNISFNIEPILDVEVRRLRLEKMRAQIIMKEQADIELRSNMSLGIRGIEKEIARYDLAPIPIAGTPFVITPQVNIVIGIMPGKLNVLEARINQEAHLSPGALYENRGWRNLSDFSNSFDFSIQRASEGIDLQVYAGPSLKLFLNGILPGAQIFVGDGLRLESRIDGSGWKLYGGLNANVGIDMNVFSRFIDNYNKQVLSSERLLKEEELNSSPNTTIPRGKIIFARKIGESAEIMMMDPDGSNQTNLTRTNTAWELQPSWSPDGKRIFFSRINDPGTLNDYNIYAMNPDGSNTKRITLGNTNKESHTISPDGEKIAYNESSSRGNGQIWMADINGLNPENITQDPEHAYGEVSWSSENKLAFSSNKDEKNSGAFARNIFIAKIDGSKIQRLTYDNWSRQPSWSPDGKLIAFSSRRTGDGEIYVMDAQGNNQKNISQNPETEEAYPSWSPDRKHIVYTSKLVGSSSESEEIWIMDYPSGSNKRQLTKNDQQDSQPDWSPR
ncbi:MAG: hypothetical protein KKC19_03480 [Nanoarchaeota archaeon]|nr:hypothetical protein [Nanoarchaeota archaeon]